MVLFGKKVQRLSENKILILLRGTPYGVKIQSDLIWKYKKLFKVQCNINDGKEITVTLEDALLSLESLRFMLGGAIKRPSSSEKVIVRHNEEVVCIEGGVVPLPKDHLTKEVLHPKATYGHPIRLINFGGGQESNGTPSKGTGLRTQLVAATESDTIELDGEHAIIFKNPKAGETTGAPTRYGDHVRIFWEEVLEGANSETETAIEVTISPDTYPGTYRVIGDTFMRSEKTGKDEPFQFIIGKAKVLSEVTITLEAEGDPSTFEMSLTVLRSTDDISGQNEMMKLVRYSINSTASGDAGNDYGSVGSGTGG